MSRGKNCRETIFVSRLSRNYPHRGVNFERGLKKPLLWGRDSLGGILGDNLGEGNCESKIASRQWGDNLCRETSIRKILAPIKIKSALPPPKPKTPPPPLKRGILWTQVFLQKERIFPGVHKIGAAISGPRIADTNFTDTRIFLNQSVSRGPLGL